MLFQQAVIEKEGSAAFAAVFKRPPASTRQSSIGNIFWRRQASRSSLPQSRRQAVPHAGRRSIGELDHGILLRQYGGEEQAAALAPRWRGGNYRLLESKADKHSVLEYSSQWRRTGGPAVLRVLPRGAAEEVEQDRISRRGQRGLHRPGDDGYFAVRLDGAR